MSRYRGTLIYVGTVAAVAAVATARFAGAGTAAATDEPAAAPTTPATPTTAPSSYTPTAEATPTATPDPVQPQPDGTVLVVGDAVMTRYGTLQLAVTFSGRDIVAIDVLSAPDWEANSVTLNQAALPVMTRSAIERDSAEIVAVSGATYTTAAYRTSLQSAIDALG